MCTQCRESRSVGDVRGDGRGVNKVWAHSGLSRIQHTLKHLKGHEGSSETPCVHSQRCVACAATMTKLSEDRDRHRDGKYMCEAINWQYRSQKLDHYHAPSSVYKDALFVGGCKAVPREATQAQLASPRKLLSTKAMGAGRSPHTNGTIPLLVLICVERLDLHTSGLAPRHGSPS